MCGDEKAERKQQYRSAVAGLIHGFLS
jgi:hypothetical protein